MLSEDETIDIPPNEILTAVLAADHLHDDGPVRRWRIGKSHIDRLKNHSVETWLPLFERHASVLRNVDRLNTLFHLAGVVLKESGAGFVRDNWSRCSPETFRGLAFAAVRCLPSEEAYGLVTDQLGRMDPKERLICKFVLGWFESRRALGWIEDNIASPVDASWGALAARSQFDWETLVKWLEAGRLLSLVALDALGLCLTMPRVPDGHRYLPLIHPPSETTFRKVLEDYREKDPAMRVVRTVEFLLANPPGGKEESHA